MGNGIALAADCSSFTDQQTEDCIIAYACPACPEYFDSLGELDCHVNECHWNGRPEEEEEEDYHSAEDSSVADADTPTVSLVNEHGHENIFVPNFVLPI
ncbi:hypothetical protein [Absidia glauca]|uniref:C2H2-type domain-containing protein n=1 Tax=Absidia glauca TaxID=4829 RepID=A0A163JA85_ABSGL|nr:hypothetical protein [Absidia glauca]